MNTQTHDEATAQAEAAMVSARSAMVLGSKAETCFFAALSLKLTLQVNDSIPTAATDGKVLIYSPRFVNTLSPPQVVGLFAHEVMHPGLGHCGGRRGDRDSRIWNIACDWVINPMLRSLGFELPPGALFPDQAGLPDGESADWYYAKIVEQEEQKQ